MKNNKFNKSMIVLVLVTMLLSLSNNVMGMSWLASGYNAAKQLYNGYKYVEENNLIEKAVTHPKVEPALNNKIFPTYAGFYAITGISFVGHVSTIAQGGFNLSVEALKWSLKKGIYFTTGYAPKILPKTDGLPAELLGIIKKQNQLLAPKTNWLRYVAGAYALSCGAYHLVKWGQETKKMHDEVMQKITTEAFNTNKKIEDSKNNILNVLGERFNKIDKNMLTKKEFNNEIEKLQKNLNSLFEQGKITQKQFITLQSKIDKSINELALKLNYQDKIALDTNTQVKISLMPLKSLKQYRDEINCTFNGLTYKCDHEEDVLKNLQNQKFSQDDYIKYYNILKTLNDLIEEKEADFNFKNNILKDNNIIKDNTENIILNNQLSQVKIPETKINNQDLLERTFKKINLASLGKLEKDNLLNFDNMLRLQEKDNKKDSNNKKTIIPNYIERGKSFKNIVLPYDYLTYLSKRENEDLTAEEQMLYDKYFENQKTTKQQTDDNNDDESSSDDFLGCGF